MAKQEIKVPNIGGAENVEVIEVLVSPGDQITKDTSLITLESDKASMEIPSPVVGTVESISVKVGDKISEGSTILFVSTVTEEKVADKTPAVSESVASTPSVKEEAPKKIEKSSATDLSSAPVKHESITIDENIHAGPAIRRMARELGVNLNEVTGSGPKSRILKEDLQGFVKAAMAGGGTKASGLNVAKMPDIDFSKFGAIEEVALNKIKKLTGVHVHRSWVTIPHVTQFDQADITELEAFRVSQKASTEKQGIKLTPLVFIMKAVVAALKKFPHFNASLNANGDTLILKKYFNLGIAVDTPNGLVVPVVRDVDSKGMLEIAEELAVISQKARDKGLSPADMSGSCFTISSLGGIGGTSFTPIINAPDVAILGVSKAKMAPVYDKGQFVPRLMLPLSLSYDHRVIDGADGARFLVYLASVLADIRTLLL